MLSLLMLACSPAADSETVECGPGTHLVDGVCVPDEDEVDTDTDADADADTDADTDTDSDADTDSATDTGTPPMPTADTAPPCPTPGYATLTWSSVSFNTNGATPNIDNLVGYLDGPGDVCSWTCMQSWAIPKLTLMDGTPVVPPLTLQAGDELRVIIAPYEPGTPGADVAHCVFEGSGGPWDFYIRID